MTRQNQQNQEFN